LGRLSSARRDTGKAETRGKYSAAAYSVARTGSGPRLSVSQEVLEVEREWAVGGRFPDLPGLLWWSGRVAEQDLS